MEEQKGKYVILRKADRERRNERDKEVAYLCNPFCGKSYVWNEYYPLAYTARGLHSRCQSPRQATQPVHMDLMVNERSFAETDRRPSIVVPQLDSPSLLRSFFARYLALVLVPDSRLHS